MRGLRCITLLTDFGLRDGYVAEMKAVLLSRLPAAVLVDVTHEVPPGDVRAAQYLLQRSWHRFPAGTVHLVVVDPGVGTARRALAVRAEGHAFVAPDNGVLTSVLAAADVAALPVPPDASPTFHGRDVFAPAAAALAAGTPLGPRVEDAVRRPMPQPEIRGDDVTGEVIHVDRFGTLVTNLTTVHVGRRRCVTVAEAHTAPILTTFGDVAPGALVAFVGSGGELEIALRDGSAAAAIGAGVGAPVRVTDA